jgi:citrate lyase subunit beta/citryl-CoA lyase
VAPVDPQIVNLTQFRVATDALNRMGFVGRACIHPTQVTVANDVFTPHPNEVLWARDVLDSFAAQSQGVARDADGQMVDEAVLRRARHVIARAQAWSTPGPGR